MIKVCEGKITQQDYIDYCELILEGYSQRKACEMLGIPRSTMYDYLNRLPAKEEKQEPKVQSKVKILILDIETSCSIAAAFGRHKIFLSQDHVVREGGKVLCVSYRWVGEEETHLIGMTKEEAIADNDSRIIAEIWELFNEADAVVAHNAAKFDIPAIKARVIANGFPPLPTVKIIDTLIMARKNFKFPSNSLDSLAAYLGLARKKDAGGITTWIKYSEGDEVAMNHMHEYCIYDTALLHDVYIKLRAFGHTGSDFNAGHYVTDQDGLVCGVCAGSVYKTGRMVYTASSKFEELRCNSCRNVQRSRESLTTKDERNKLTSNVKING